MVELIGAAQMAELKYALRSVTDEVADVVLSELEDIAKGVAADARKRVPHRTGRAAQSYRAHGAAVVFGDGVPYVPWLEFGGAVGRNKSVTRPYVREGRYIGPALRENFDIETRVDDLIAQMTAGYLEVEG